jgi:hypothetical protein
MAARLFASRTRPAPTIRQCNTYQGQELVQ